MKNKNYEAGKCNIGDSEVNRRKRILKVSVLIMILFSLYILFINHTLLLIILLLITSCGTFLNYYQVTNRFCVMHGLTHTAKFLDNETEKIKDLNFIKKDTNLVFGMFAKSILLSFGYTTIIYLLSIL